MVRTRTRTLNREPRLSKRNRAQRSAYRKTALASRGVAFSQLAAVARRSYSLAEKWVNARRESQAIADAFLLLTGKPANAGRRLRPARRRVKCKQRGVEQRSTGERRA